MIFYKRFLNPGDNYNRLEYTIGISLGAMY